MPPFSSVRIARIQRTLRGIAATVVSVPAGIGCLAQMMIWLIPECTPYLGECMVGETNLATPLLITALGGFGIALLATVFVAVPVLLISIGLRRRKKRGDGHDA